jgi:uncharacterized protein YjiK
MTSGLPRLLLVLELCAGASAQRVAAQSPTRPAAAAEHYALTGSGTWHAKLPKGLDEVSGLAFASDNSLLAHGDERAVLWRYDLARRQASGRFALGNGRTVLRDDFEDVAVAGDRLFLTTGKGMIYEGRVAPAGRTGRAVQRTRGFGQNCEVEGMTYDPDTRSLLLLCKHARTRQWKNQVIILAVSVDTWRFEARPRALVSEQQIERVTGNRRFHGSGMVRHPKTGTLLLVAGPERTFLELGATGAVLGGGRLDRDRHRQPEGIAVSPDLTVLIADEAAGHRASITAYAYRP